MFDPNAPSQTGGISPQGGMPSAMHQQNLSLVGTPPIQQAAMPAFDPSVLNSTAINASDPNVANMIKALKGDAQ